MAHLRRLSVRIFLPLLITSCLCTILLTSAKEISSNGIKRISAADWEKALNDHPELREVVNVADNGEVHPYVHSRNRRTIGRVFDMFRGLFDRIFGGKKGGGGGGGYGPPKRPAASYGPPKKQPAAGYGPPQNPKPAYGPPNKPNGRAPKPGYGSPGPQPRPPAPRPPAPRQPQPRPQQNRPRPQGPPRQRPQRPQGPAQQGYGGPRPAQPAPGGYGGPQAPRQPNYGGGQQAPRQPVAGGADIDGYGSPQAPVVGGGDIDGYGAPQAPVVGGGDIDGYGAPQAPVVGGGDIDGYGSPQAPPVGGGGNIDSYGSPQAQVVGGGNIGGGVRNPGQYGSPPAPLGGRGQPNYGAAPQQFRRPQQPGPSIQLSVGAPFPRAPISNNGPTSASLADSVFRMIPAPNLATGRPPTAVRNNAQGNQDSYGSPQGPVIVGGGGVQVGGVIVGGVQASDSYGSPQGSVIGGGLKQASSSSVGNSYGSPVAPTSSSNPFIGASAPPLSVYTSQATLPVQPSGNIIIGTGKAQAPSGDANIITIGSSAVAPAGSYGSPTVPQVIDQQQGSGVLPGTDSDSYSSPVGPVVSPITDIDLPAVIPEAIVPGVEPRVQPAVSPKDVYGSPVAPVGTSAPVPQNVLQQIENNLPGFTNPEYTPGDVSVPEGELVKTTVEDDVEVGDGVEAASNEYEEIEEEVIDELVSKIQSELDDPNLIKDPEDEKFLNEVITNLKAEKDVINTIEYIDPTTGTGIRSEGQDTYGGPSDVDSRGNDIDDEPLFDNIRDGIVDPPATGTPGPTIDLSGGFVDFSNGVLGDSSDGQSTVGEINLTGTTTPAPVDYEVTTEIPEEVEYQDTYDETVDQAVAATTSQPVYEDNDEYDLVDEVDDDDEYDEGEQGYDIQVPENPLDAGLTGRYINF